MPFFIVRQDITKMKVDAVVNAANTRLAMGGGVCGAIFNCAGAEKLQEACRPLAPIRTGEAVITPGFRLPAKYVIHAAGPIYDGKRQEESRSLLYNAYRSSLEVACRNGCQSIAFPLISSGIYGYPKEEALEVAVSAIRDFLRNEEMDVYLVIFDRDSFAVSLDTLGAVQSYIDENYVSRHTAPTVSRRCEEMAPIDAAPQVCSVLEDLSDRIRDMDRPFNEILFRLIDARGLTDVQVYKKANLDRKLFSKIRTGKGYIPSKRTILALAIALELSLEETDALLETAGYALSHSQKFDVIVEYFIISGNYNIFEINEVLFRYDQHLLGTN